MKKVINGIKIDYPENLSDKEVMNSYEDMKNKIQNKQLQSIVLRVVKKNDGFYVKETIRNDEDIQRLRRITGYISTDVRFFNDAKRAEVRDRVKHG